MPVPTQNLATSDSLTPALSSYKRQLQQIGPVKYGYWTGYATVKAGVLAASLSIITPSRNKGWADQAEMIIPANALIHSVAMRPLKTLTLGAATGKLKLATALNAATATLFVESAAATANTLIAPAAEVATRNITPVTVGASDVTYKIYATDGGAGAAAGASTVTATTDTKILVAIGFKMFADFPGELDVGESVPFVGNEIVSY